jgi:hypothetical protein
MLNQFERCSSIRQGPADNKVIISVNQYSDHVNCASETMNTKRLSAPVLLTLRHAEFFILRAVDAWRKHQWR